MTTSISGYVYTVLTAAAFGSGVACYDVSRAYELRSLLHTLTVTDSRSTGRMVLARKMKSCHDVTIALGITTIVGDLINRNANLRPKSKYFDMKLGGGGFD